MAKNTKKTTTARPGAPGRPPSASQKAGMPSDMKHSEKAGGLGAPSGAGVGPAVPSGGSAPRPEMGRAHENVGRSGAHAMEVPGGMPTGQGGTRNPNRVSSSGSQVEVSTPAPHNLTNQAEPTNPRYTPETTRQDPDPGMPPTPSGPHNVPDTLSNTSPLPNNPRGGVLTGSLDRPATRPRMY